MCFGSFHLVSEREDVGSSVMNLVINMVNCFTGKGSGQESGGTTGLAV